MRDKNTHKKKSLRRVAIGAILFGALMILVLAVFIEVILFVYPTMQNYKREMNHEASYALSLIGDDYLKEIFEKTREMYYSTPEEIRREQFTEEYMVNIDPLLDESYEMAREILKNCRIEAEMEAVLFAFMDEENERLVVTIDGNESSIAFLPGQWISSENGSIDDFDTIEKIVSSNTYMSLGYGVVSGFTATDYVPIYVGDHELLGYAIVNVAINSIVNQIMLFLAVYIPVMAVVLIGMSVLTTRAVDNRIIQPINSLARGARKYMNLGDVDPDSDIRIFNELHVNTNDEIEELWTAMVDMEDDISKAMKQVRDAAAKEERIATELDLAKDIQFSALPTNFPAFPKEKRFDIYASMRPAKEVGGDFYDFFMIDDDHLGMVIADVAGKGVPAALFMMISKSLLKNRTLQGGKPSEILESVNDSLSEDNSSDMFVTVWLAIMTLSTGEVIAANAGHEYPFVTDENGAYKLFKEPHGIVLGAMRGMKFEDYTFTVPQNGRIFVYTDGVAEAQNKDEELFGVERIEECLNKYMEEEPDKLVAAMAKEVDSYAAEVEQFDDITMLNICYKGI